jgi:hypothetical protein
MVNGELLATEKLGNTVFEIRREVGGNLAIIRKNSDGEVTFYVPRGLLDQYVVEVVTRKLSAFVRKVLL